MNIKDLLATTAVSISLIGTAGAGGTWLADQRYVTENSLKALQYNQIDREKTLLEIKKSQGEASKSELIYLETLKQQLRALQQ